MRNKQKSETENSFTFLSFCSTQQKNHKNDSKVKPTRKADCYVFLRDLSWHIHCYDDFYELTIITPLHNRRLFLLYRAAQSERGLFESEKMLH